MCFLVAKNIDEPGSIALQMQGGKDIIAFKKMLDSEFGHAKLQLITISRPSAYGEYAPYSFVDSKEKFKTEIKKII